MAGDARNLGNWDPPSPRDRDHSPISATSPVMPAGPSNAFPRGLRPTIPPPMPGRNWRCPGRAQPNSPGQLPPKALPSPRRLAPLGGGAYGELGDRAGGASRASEADAAAGGRSSSSSAAAMIADSEASPGRRNSWDNELCKLQPLMATPQRAAGGSGQLDPLSATNSERQQPKRGTKELLADALSPAKSSCASSSAASPNSARTPRSHRPRNRKSPTRRSPPDEIDMSATGQFWNAYEKTHHIVRDKAWKEPTPQRSIANRAELDDMHVKRRLKLVRLIKTGQLPAAALVASGVSDVIKPRPDTDVKDEVKKQLEVMAVQRRGLIEQRKVLEKLVNANDADEKAKNDELKSHLGFMLRGLNRKN